PGWRLGGKCASGRNLAAGGRIEEHGLHVWFGFYDNAFRMARSVYEELARPADHPIATLEQAFEGCDELVLCDRQRDGWQAFRVTFPHNDMQPGGDHELPDFGQIAARVCGLAVRHLLGLSRYESMDDAAGSSRSRDRRVLSRALQAAKRLVVSRNGHAPG